MWRKTLFWPVLLLLSSALPSLATAQNNGGEEFGGLTIAPDPQYFRLVRSTSGHPRVVYALDHGLATSTVCILINAGYADEPAAEKGGAALAAKLLAARLGRSFAARTFAQSTLLTTTIPKEQLPELLSFVTDQLKSSKTAFVATDAATVSLGEKFEGLTQIALARLLGSNWYDMYLANRITNAPSQEFREAGLAFARRFYRADHETIIVATDTVTSRVTTSPMKNAPVARAAARAASDSVIFFDAPDADRTVVAGALVIPEGLDSLAVDVFANALSGSFTSRLFHTLTPMPDEPFNAGVRYFRSRSTSALLFFAEVRPVSAIDALKAVQQVIEGVADYDPLTPLEVGSTGLQGIQRLGERWQQSIEVARSTADLTRLALPDDYYQRFVAALRAATPRGVAQTAKQVFTNRQISWVALGPLAKVLSDAPIIAIAPGTPVSLDIIRR